jgi:hypothetical protein
MEHGVVHAHSIHSLFHYTATARVHRPAKHKGAHRQPVKPQSESKASAISHNRHGGREVGDGGVGFRYLRHSVCGEL